MTNVEVTAVAKQRLQAIVDAVRSLESTVHGLVQASAVSETAPIHAPRASDETIAQGAMLELTDGQRRICERVINVFETGTVEGKYGAISIYADGPNRIRQITYGRSQTTEYGNLQELVQMYADANGTFSTSLRPYIDRIGTSQPSRLVDDETFKDLLRKAGNDDPVMRATQDRFFDLRYFQPASRWARDNGFAYALSMLVIYDSFIHSGRIRQELRDRFPERPPAQGGDEKTWIRQYVDVRHTWLTNHSNPAVRPSNYRTRDLKREIAAGNWDLAIQPFMANGVPVRDTSPAGGMLMHALVPEVATPSLVGFNASMAPLEEEQEWCEIEPPASAAVRALASVETPADMASRILNHSSIRLATEHVSGVNDAATARQNIADTAAGQPARRSSYGNAPGGTVRLDPNLLRGLLTLAEEYSFDVSELCGGSHSPTSRHYAGVTADINFINGQHVSASHPAQAAFRSRCRDLGATEVLGPGNAHHSTHIHAAWPRPV